MDVELAAMSARKRGTGSSGQASSSLELEDGSSDDRADQQFLLGDRSESVGSLSKEPKAAKKSTGSPNMTVCLAVALIVGGAFMVLSGKFVSQEEGR